MESSKEPWHLSRSVPISIIIGLLIQTATFVWFLAGMDAQVRSNTEWRKGAEAKFEAIRETASSQAVKLGQIGTQLDSVEGKVDRAINILERGAWK